MCSACITAARFRVAVRTQIATRVVLLCGSYECGDHFGNVVLFALWAWLATMQQPQQFYFELRSPYSVLWVSRTYFCGLPQRGSMTFNEALKHVTCVWAGAPEVLSR